MVLLEFNIWGYQLSLTGPRRPVAGLDRNLAKPVRGVGGLACQPHRAKTFKLSSDLHFVEKVCDIVGLYISPKDRALVLRVEQKLMPRTLDSGY